MKNNMKLGLVTLLLSSSFLLGCSPNITPEEKPHEHLLTCFEAKDATYYNDGNIKYYYCQVCNKKFSDSEGTKEITDEEIIIKKKNISDEVTEITDVDDPLIKNATIYNGVKKFVSLSDKEGQGDTEALYVTHNEKENYTSITFSLSETSPASISFNYRYVDTCKDREFDLYGHNFLTKKLSDTGHEFIPHSGNKINNDGAWHTFTYNEAEYLTGEIAELKICIYHFVGTLIVNNVVIE